MPKADATKTIFKLLSFSPRSSIRFKQHTHLLLDDTDLNDLKKLPQNIKEDIPLAYMPYVVREKGSKLLVVITRHLSHVLNKISGARRHYILIENDNEGIVAGIIANLQKNEEEDMKLIKTQIGRQLNPKKQSELTTNRDAQRQRGLICPGECSDIEEKKKHKKGRKRKPGALFGPLNEKPINKDMAGNLYIATCFDSIPLDDENARMFYVVSCDNSYQHKNNTDERRCSFGCLLTEFEFAEFKTGRYPFTRWVDKLEREKCPGHNCQYNLYVRTYHTENCVMKVVVCGSKFDKFAVNECGFERGYYEWLASRGK